MTRVETNWSGAFGALLLLFLFALAGCAGLPAAGGAEQESASERTGAGSYPAERASQRGSFGETTREESALPETAAGDGSKEQGSKEQGSKKRGSEKTVEAVLPEDVLSEDELAKPQRYRDWNKPGAGDPKQLVSGDSSAGAIPAVRPFNFGRDPGGPEDKTLYLTVPKLGLADVPVYNSASEKALTASTVHVPATGFPWQRGANTFIAGHRLGYEGTGSFRIFYSLNRLAPGDKILLEDAAGGEYRYRVTRELIVAPDNVEVMNAVEGRSLVSLQTCTLPDYSERLVVQGELVEASG